MHYVLDDFLEEELNNLSLEDLEEVKKIREDGYRLERSYLIEQIKYYVLPFIER